MQDPREQNKKVRTKAAMLQELESIKGLLLEEDEIPILQEVIEPSTKPQSAAAPKQPPLSKQALHQLQDDFRALSQTMGSPAPTPQASPARQPQPEIKTAQTSAGLLDAFTRSSQYTGPHANESVQVPLFNEAATDLLDFSEPLPASPTNKNHRPSLAKAQGENPFLPQHIRARLNGNNPLPTSNPPAAVEPPSRTNDHLKAPHAPAHREPDTRQQLVDELVGAMLPDLEQDLRKKLAGLSQDALKRLLNQS